MDDFKKRCDDFSATEEAAIIAAMDEARTRNPNLNGPELLNEVVVALIAGSWRTALTLNSGLPHEDIKRNWLQVATDFADNNSTLPEEN